MINNNYDYISTIITRVMIVIFWLAIIVLFLYSPSFFVWIRSTRSINIVTFPRVIDASMMEQFERETGIKVYLSYYENNDELLVKMRQTKGEGYDLIIPSDYAVDILRREGLLQPIDKQALPFFDKLHPKLVHQYYDPASEFSIPYVWGLYGMGVDKDFFHAKEFSNSWDAIFNKEEIFYKIGMVNNAREAILLAARYLFGSIDNLESSKLSCVRKLLLKQKEWVQAYTDLAPDYLLLSGSAPVVVGLSSDIMQAHKVDSTLGFVFPQEGAFMVVDAFAIPSTSKKTKFVYELLRFLYRPKILQYHSNKFSVFSSLVLDKAMSFETMRAFLWLDAVQNVDFFRNVLPEKELQEIWFLLKSA